MSLNLQLFLLFLMTTLKYGFLGFTLSMFLDILIIIFLYSSLHSRRFMSQARRTRHFERSAKRGRSARRREEKNKAPVTSPFLSSSAHLRVQVLNNGGDVKRTNENKIYYSKIFTFLSTRNTGSSIKPQEKQLLAKITFNNVRLGAAKLIK